LRFENPTAVGTSADPRFAALYDIATPGPCRRLAGDRELARLSDGAVRLPTSRLIVPEFRGSYALVGARTTAGAHGHRTAVYVVLSNGSDDTARATWAADVLGMCRFHAASRFRLIEGFPEPAQWLDILETDAAAPVAPTTTHPRTEQQFAGLFLPAEGNNA
jgi:hypothetical protein